MNLIPWRNKSRSREQEEGFSPMAPMTRLRDEMDRMFDRFTKGWGFEDFDFPNLARWWGPAVDLSETDDEVIVTAELPGMDPKELEVSIAGNVLTISGQRKEEHEERHKGFYRSERRAGNFRRSVQLPSWADANKISAEYENGILTVHLKKDEKVRPKKVPVHVTPEHK